MTFNLKSMLTTAVSASAIALTMASGVFAGSPEENKAIVERYLDATFNRADFAVTDELVSADFLDHGNARVPSRGREKLKEEVVSFRGIFPDLDVELSHVIAEGDLVAYRFVSRSIGLDDRPFEITGLIIDRIENGQIVERWENYDEVGAKEYFAQQ